MKDTHMVVLWEHEDGSGPIMSQRYGIGHVEPVLDSSPPRVATLVAPTVTSWRPGNYSTTTFQIPVNQTAPRPGQIIWAYSLRRPEPDTSADLMGHYVAGTVNMDLSKQLSDSPGQPTPESTRPTLETQAPEDALTTLPRYQKLIWHGILVSLGFLVLLPAGSLVARWTRTFTSRWFKVHRIVNFGVALPVILTGWVLGPLAVLDRQAKHFIDPHQICGFLLLVLYLVQLWLGRYIHSKHAVADRAPHPPSNIVHAVLGISIIGLAFFQVRSGMGEWKSRTGRADVSHWYQDALVAWAILLPILYFAGLALLRRQFAQEKQGMTYADSPVGKDYIALSNAPSPIVFDSEPEMGYSELESGVPLLQRST
ncbi:hypothetical protein B0H10DRAFT_791584 [Mycena sp. CBHHK59/15]|nr:hypothetical protein B0H10DRAFT_791584 [Mycena sp. CBHHK59/15]